MKNTTTLLVTVLLALQAYAGLEFEQMEIVNEATMLDEKAEAVFRFTNTGEETVTVMDPASSCGCTVPKLEKKEYAPGESGEIKAIFTFGSRVGVQRKRITLRTTDPAAETYTLNMVTHIPEWVKVEPRVLRWKLNDAVTPREITVTVAQPEKVELDMPEAAFQYFDLQTDEVKPGQYLLTITPKSLDAKATEFLRFTAQIIDAGTKRNRQFGVHCLVR